MGKGAFIFMIKKGKGQIADWEPIQIIVLLALGD